MSCTSLAKYVLCASNMILGSYWLNFTFVFSKTCLFDFAKGLRRFGQWQSETTTSRIE